MKQIFNINIPALIRVNVLLAMVLILSLNLNAQDRYSTKSGDMSFEASVPSFEPVAAINNTVSAILKPNGDIGVLVLIKGFKFENGLMQEHFSQKGYMHSEKFPNSKFLGKIIDFNINELSENPKEFTIKGKLTVKNISKEIETSAQIKMVNQVIYLQTKFSVEVVDFEIAVKSSLSKKVAKTVNIVSDLELK